MISSITHTRNAPPPFLFRCFKALKRHHVRGAHRMLLVWQRMQGDCLVLYPLSPSVNIAVPINRMENAWELQDILGYERDLIRTCCAALTPFRDVRVFDCGADIGLFTALLCARCDRIGRVVAFEPNSRVEQVLRHNLAQFPRPEVHMAAVSNFIGRGRLLAPAYDLGDHARFLVRAEEGIPVMTVDSLELFGGDVLLKIDVEGEELQVLLGTLGSMTVMRLVVQPIWVCRLAQLPYRDYLKLAGSALGGTLVAASLAWLICGWAIRPAYWQLASSAGVAVCVYGMAVLFLVFSSADRRRVGSALAPLTRLLHPHPLPAIASPAPPAQ